MISLHSLFVVSFSLLSTANGTNICGTKDPTEDDVNDAREVTKEWKERNKATIGDQVITIDTVWHRITSGDQGNSETDVTKSMVVLNNAFAPHFKFNLMMDTVSDEPHFWDPPSYGDGGMRMHLHEGDCSVLNIYSTKTSTFGYAEYPSRCARRERMDGVVISYDTVPGGADQMWNEGYNLVHEVGHWMNLFHTFQGGCAGIGDGIKDTPASSSPNLGCPQGKDSCPSEGIDPIHNFMDYSNDSCRTSFTSEQFTRMKAAWYKYRYFGPTRPTTLPTNAPSMTGASNEPTRVRTECLMTKPRDHKFFDKTSKGMEDLRKEVQTYCKNPDIYDNDTYGPIEHWDVSRITDMNNLFAITFNGALKDCNPDISRWHVSAVTDFARMFDKQKFNKDISCWDVSSGTTFDFMFGEDEAFNMDIGDWDVSKGTTFAGMFSETPFNQDIGDWDMSKSFHLDGMFHKARAFNQDISRWDVSNAYYFNNMFDGAESFNQPIKWDLSSGYYFDKMLQNAKSFRQNMDHWLKWIDNEDTSSSGWYDGAVCDLACDVLSNKKCKYEKDSCTWGKGKIFGECVPKKSKYKHDCDQYADESSCSADGYYGGLCKFDDGMCRHICDDLEKKSCVKVKNVHGKKMCKKPKVKNPCKKCQPKTTCG